MSEWIYRDLLLYLLQKASIPVTRNEREIIMTMPTKDEDEIDFQKHSRDVRLLAYKIRDRNKRNGGIYDDDGGKPTSNMENEYIILD